MNKAIKTTLTALGIGVLLSLVIYTCKKPTTDINLIVNTTSLSKAPYLIQFTNANSASKTIVPKSLAVTISGTGASLVQLDGGGTDFTAVNGLLPLSLIRSAKPSTTNPVTFTIYASASGFVPVSKTITLTADSAINTIVPLTEYASPPAGTSGLVKQTTLKQGTSPENTLTTPYNSLMTEGLTITIPDGTQLMDENKAVINATTLKSSIVYYGTSTADSYNAFPDGFNPASVLINGKVNKAVNFITAGMASVSMVAGTTVVRNFSQPLLVNAEINSELINPTTGVKVKVNDVIPLWSFNEQTDQWTNEGTVKVIKNGNGKLAVSFPMTHLSAWAINWYTTNCASTLNMKVHVANTSVKLDDYSISLVTANGQYLGGIYADDSWSHTVTLYDGFSTVLKNLPSSWSGIKLVVYSTAGNPKTKVAESDAFTPCGKGSVDITVPAPTSTDVVNTVVNTEVQCSGKQIVDYPAAWLYITDITAGVTKYVYMRNGTLTCRLINGHSYTLSTAYNSKVYTSKDFKFNKAATTVISSSTGLSGTASFNAATNTMTVSVKFSAKCST